MIPLYLQHPVKRNMKNLARVILPILLGVVWVLLLGFWLMPKVGAVSPAAPLLQPGNPVTDPPRNTHTAPATTTVSIAYDEEINGATVSTRTFAVHAMQTGLLTRTYGVSGGTISLTPTRPFKPDELVQVSATTRTLNWSGQGPVTSTVWQFRAAVTGGSGVFTDSGQRLGNSYSRDVALGDVDGDGDLDAVVANSGTGQANQVWLNDGSGSFADSGRSLGISITYAIALGDLDGDGDLDAFVANRGEASQVWLNDGRGAFTDSGQGLGGASFSQAVALGDVDGDGDLDALIANVGPNQVWLNNGAGVFTSSGPGLGNADSRDVALGDVDGDGDLDAFFANQGTSVACNEVWRNNGSGLFTDSRQCLGHSDSWAVALGDMDGNGTLDAVVANYGPNEVWLSDGTGTFSDSGQRLGNSKSRGVALGDLDGDGDLDAFVANQGTSVVCNEVWLNSGSGFFTDSQQCLGHSDSWAVALGDLKSNGALDAFVANHGEASTAWRAALPAISLNKTVGTETGLCDIHHTIGVTAGAQVVYCYRVTNVGDVALTTHVLTDTRLGRILSDSHHLAPGATWFATTTSVLTRTTINTATWVASAGDYVATATDSAMVAVIDPAVQINQVIPNPSWFLEDVLFDGSGTPPTTTSLLKEYEWTLIPASATCGSPITTLLGTAARIRDNHIPIGTHRICLRGKTYNDVWSGYVMTTTTVRPDRWALSDIAVGPKSVSFWKDPSAQDDPVYHPDVGDTVYARVEVHNISIHDTPDTVTVSFYDGPITASLYAPITGMLVGTKTIASIAAQTSQFVTIPWTIAGEVGYRPFAVDVGYTENISYFAHYPLPPYTEPYSETDYTNNRVIGAIPVGHVTGTYGISVTADVLPIDQPRLYAGYYADISGKAQYDWDVFLPTMGATTTIVVSDFSGVAVACRKTYQTWTTSPLGNYRVTIPLPYKPGVYQASVIVDDGNLRSDAQEVTFTVSEPPRPLPDLYIERFSVLLSGPNTYVRTWNDYTFQRVYYRSRLFGVQSQPITITARVQNGGNLAVPGSFTVSFYDGTPGDGGTRIGTEIINGLAAGAAKRIEHVWTPARTGIHVIQAVVDETNQIGESNETNNYDGYYYTYQACFNDVASDRCRDAAHRDIIEVRAANPDLRALGLNYVEPDLGKTVTMTVDVHNIGHRDIITPGGVFTVTVYDGYPNIGVASTRMLTAPGELGPTRAVSLYRGTHRTYDVVWNTGYTGPVPGPHHICVEVDTGAEIAEEIEENNVNCWDLYVFPDEADLEPYELTYSNNCPLPNEPITITAHFRNMGAQDFTVTQTEVVTFYHTSINPTHVISTTEDPPAISGLITGRRGTGATSIQWTTPGSHGTTYIFVEYIKTNGSYNLGPHRYARRLNICKIPSPNLRILSGDIHVNPRSPASNEPVSVAVDVANVSQSSNATATNFIVEFHTSGPTVGYHELGQPRTIASLGPGMITTVLASTPFAMADKFYAVQASAWPRVEQGDEYYGDNEATTSIVRGNARMLALTVTVGTIPGVCASTDAITVYTGTLVFYCYQMTNQGEVHLSVHDVYDDKLGNVLSGYAYDLSQGETFTWVQQVNLARTIASTATWVASAAPYTFIGTDTAIVNVRRIYLPVVRKASGN